jgi:hypothetical protein
MLQRELDETRNTLQRQRLLKELWHIEQARQAEEADQPNGQLPTATAFPVGHAHPAVAAPSLVQH